MTHRRRHAALACALLLAACGSPSGSHDLMPAPGLYADAGYDPFGDAAPLESLPDFQVLYATLRDPAGEDDAEEFYTNRRGNLLRVGTARVRAGDADFTWEQARRVSLAKNRPGSYPLDVTEVDELGVIASSIFAPADVRADEERARAAFAAAVDERLGRSGCRDVFVYVHGYKVVFENPVLVASELWHFLGYRGAMVAFAWPSTPKRLAYFSDLETAELSARGLRLLLERLATDTRAERVHVLGYSAGTRVVVEALGQVALMHRGDDRDAIAERWKLGRVVLVGSDVDRHIMGAHLEDGLLGVVESVTAYMSDSDKALGFSRWALGGRSRLGQVLGPGEMLPETEAFLHANPRVALVDVTDAEEFDAGNGHSYFRRSPWAASDVLLTLAHGLPPGERGLVQLDGTPVWRFPPDYVARLEALLPRLVPGYREGP